jgi:hypothetical protein
MSISLRAPLLVRPPLGFGCSLTGRRLGIGWQGVNHLAGTGVVELFAGLMLNGAGIVLQAVDVAAQAVVFALQFLHLELQCAGVLTFLLVGGEAVMAENDVKAHEDREHGCGNGRDRAARAVRAVLHRVDGACPLRPSRYLFVFSFVAHTGPSTFKYRSAAGSIPHKPARENQIGYLPCARLA